MRIDALLLANQLLRNNISQVKAARAANQEVDTNPSLADLERTHVLFVNAHCKPYVAIAFQYFKQSANNVTLGSEVAILIAQYGEFFADMVANVVIRSPTTSLTRGTKSLTPSDVTLYRHCDYPGERIFDEVRFEVNSNPIDSYHRETCVIHRQLHVPTDKMVAWNRYMGQEEPSTGVAPVPDASSMTTPVTARVKHQVYDGYQTWKPSHRYLVLWVQLLFWFSTNISLAFPSDSVPYGQRFITFRLTQMQNLYHQIINPAAQADDAKALMLSTPQISTFNLYINNMFVLPEVHDIFIDRVAFTLIRVLRRQTQNLNKSSDSIHLVQLKWPIETLTFGFQPTINRAVNPLRETLGSQATTVSPHMEDWHRFCTVTNTWLTDGAVTGAGAMNIKYETAHITKLQLQAHSVDLFAGFPAQFFNSYIPYQFGGAGITAPTDTGLYFYSFTLHPTQYQPSGYFNASRARELYLDYTSSFISSEGGRTAKFFVHAKAINFILVSEGSCSLRYST
ncbi:hypothetical protein PC116_g18213 [Phytophthora cactorum]|uniref:Uncharacterized protein n=1 Tax=Phytophthora cactorum TaxID=29920 RepID=A0A8T1FT01_9STRA|nr:hypothetical protein PC111_g15214 [Phytophthora cactorum]KAG2816168.1 hypothetical protein PC112_g13580 [Phytophthora cactorum]KAG2840185.1 hypothetical protein PC113_g19318 [Phytophthora cactorum]KAG2981217.1 hypothetical protein PC118_g10754 [Phytophthora cactorum]KAG3153081.1 hypothetical protein C6341_g16083 [Phytophthora cactorum]